ncbi:hypothetical protein, partial [Rhizobium johnstonii]|uniref:hypothetical protein n=1 Tax=Rhizobium johnstonii TaxID=3019933 RepID=UPI003F98B275
MFLTMPRGPETYLAPSTSARPNSSRFKIIILANASCLSDAQNAAIRAYVDRGGSVIASYETSLRDEFGKKR